MAWDEWEQLKSETSEGGTTGMRLNQLPVLPGWEDGYLEQ